MKIVFNTDQIYLLGGIEKIISTKANYWCNLPDTEVYIVTTEQKQNLPYYSLDPRVKLIDLGVNYNRYKSYFSLNNLKKAWKHYMKQRGLFKNLNPDFIISPNYNFDHYWLPFIKNKAKLIKERHSSRYLEVKERDNASILRRLKFGICDWIDSKYDNIVVLNSSEAEYVKSGNVVVIPNPVKVTKLQADISNKKVIAAGRLAPVKGFDHLIKAWTIIHQQEPSWELHIYGDNYNNTKEYLEQLINENCLDGNVFLKEAVRDIPSVMKDYSIYALTSVTDCFPTVLLEALSVGLPIVSYDCPNGPRHILTDKNDGLLAKDQNIEDLAKKMLFLMKNENIRYTYSKNAKENVKRFTLESVMNIWIKILKN